MATAAAPARFPLWIVTLLAALMFVNYIDRGSLAVAAPLLTGDLHLRPAALGMLLSAFFYSYTLVQPLAGMAAERWPIRRVLAVALVVWAGGTMACGLAGGFASLFALRLIVGLGESVIFPANARFLAANLADGQRGRANAMISAGMALGPVGGTLGGGLILATYGWRAVFLAMGGFSLLWLVPWFATRLPAPQRATAAAPPAPGWGAILSQRQLWASGIGQFCYAYTIYLLLTWLPSFLVHSEHFTLRQMPFVGAGVALCQAGAALTSGSLTDRAIARGGDPSAVRKRFKLGGMGGMGVMLALASVAPHGWVVLCLAGTGLCCGLMSPLIFTTTQALAGPSAAGRWMGAQNVLGNTAGMVAPAVTGVIVQATGSFAGAFLVPALLSVIGLIAWGPMLGEITPVRWGGAAEVFA